ncbi:MAG: transcription factor [archaeon]
MKLSNKLIDGVIKEVVGEDAVPLVRMLKNKKNISEFKIAESIARQINETRNMLYRLYHANLVSFIRRKDKKKGWYIYYWTFNAKRIKHLMSKMKKERLEKLRDRLARESGNHFFVCNSGCMRLDFEQATEFEYRCPECGSMMNHDDNAEIIETIKEEIVVLEKAVR